MKKEEVLKLINEGHELVEFQTNDYGTSSFTRPIKRSGKMISSFKIGNKAVHHKTGKSILASGILRQEKLERTLGGYKKIYKLK